MEPEKDQTNAGVNSRMEIALNHLALFKVHDLQDN